MSLNDTLIEMMKPGFLASEKPESSLIERITENYQSIKSKAFELFNYELPSKYNSIKVKLKDKYREAVSNHKTKPYTPKQLQKLYGTIE
ncbi:MAG: hypothetical protein WC376_05930 [Candidatus Nanoarchaeia archaeon]|jgi:hypothetical protein